MGYWSIDYLALDYGDLPVAETTTVTASSAVDHDGADVAGVLMAKDDSMHVMSGASDWVKLMFDVPPQPAGTRRSVFLESYGYYRIRTPKGLPEQTALIKTLSETNGGIVEYSMDEYLKLRSRVLSSN